VIENDVGFHMATASALQAIRAGVFQLCYIDSHLIFTGLSLSRSGNKLTADIYGYCEV